MKIGQRPDCSVQERCLKVKMTGNGISRVSELWLPICRPMRLPVQQGKEIFLVSRVTSSSTCDLIEILLWYLVFQVKRSAGDQHADKKRKHTEETANEHVVEPDEGETDRYAPFTSDLTITTNRKQRFQQWIIVHNDQRRRDMQKVSCQQISRLLKTVILRRLEEFWWRSEESCHFNWDQSLCFSPSPQFGLLGQCSEERISWYTNSDPNICCSRSFADE